MTGSRAVHTFFWMLYPCGLVLKVLPVLDRGVGCHAVGKYFVAPAQSVGAGLFCTKAMDVHKRKIIFPTNTPGRGCCGSL